jgi:GAF domain-containing protein
VVAAWNSDAPVPIPVGGRVSAGGRWGLVAVASTCDPLPADSEERLVAFTELVATAIANAQARLGAAVTTLARYEQDRTERQRPR